MSRASRRRKAHKRIWSWGSCVCCSRGRGPSRRLISVIRSSRRCIRGFSRIHSTSCRIISIRACRKKFRLNCYFSNNKNYRSRNKSLSKRVPRIIKLKKYWRSKRKLGRIRFWKFKRMKQKQMSNNKKQMCKLKIIKKHIKKRNMFHLKNDTFNSIKILLNNI